MQGRCGQDLDHGAIEILRPSKARARTQQTFLRVNSWLAALPPSVQQFQNVGHAHFAVTVEVGRALWQARTPSGHQDQQVFESYHATVVQVGWTLADVKNAIATLVDPPSAMSHASKRPLPLQSLSANSQSSGTPLLSQSSSVYPQESITPLPSQSKAGSYC